MKENEIDTLVNEIEQGFMQRSGGWCGWKTCRYLLGNLLADKDSEVRTYLPINIIFDGPPAPESGRFVEVEDDNGHGLHVGEWIERLDGLWALRITELPAGTKQELQERG